MSEYIENSPLNYYQLRFLDEYMVGHKGFIAGGCFKNIFKNEKVKDIDMWFENEEQYHVAKKHFEALIEVSPERWVKSYENDNVWAVYDKKKNYLLELVKKCFGTPEEILNYFDFTIVKIAYFKVEEDEDVKYKVKFHKDFFEHLHLKRLVIDDDTTVYPINTFERMLKYAKYGYQPCKETKIKLLEILMTMSVDEVDVESFLSKSLYQGLD
jgi:hypothetical protein|uniref:Nucleotidyltransferase n=1 Tax=Siphoviridae sp. ctpoI7 TaxID=2825678 RepID=A0A8S5P976_9CAUD|nr:MAG TPA: Nucleotidyltransferase [Siphoviridae sp. ctpoI7]